MKLIKKLWKSYLKFANELTGLEFGENEKIEKDTIRTNYQVGDQVLSIRVRFDEQEAYRKASQDITKLYERYSEEFPYVPEIHLLAFIALKEKIANNK